MASSQSTGSENYAGSDNLEVMLEAVNYNNYLRSLIREHRGSAARVLDFGAGIGTFTDAAGLSPSAISCVEPDLAAQQILRDKGYQVYADLAEVDDTFDYIFTLNVLEHIEDDAAAARQLYDLLEPGGVLFAYVPAFNAIRTSMDDLVGHHRRYTRDSLQHICLQAGFVTETLRYTDFIGYFASLFFKLMDTFKDAPDGRINTGMLKLYDRVVFPLSRLLSKPFAHWLGKNVYIVAQKPA